MRTGFSERQMMRHSMRHEAAHDILRNSGVSSVLDLGCGDGLFIERLVRDDQIKKLTGIDENPDSLAVAEAHVRPLANLRKDIELIFKLGSLLTAPRETPGHEAITMIEVIEHLDPSALGNMEQLIFGELNPSILVLTTPAALESGAPSRPEHQFEWTPDEASQWSNNVAAEYGYKVGHLVLSSAPLPGLDMQIINFERAAT